MRIIIVAGSKYQNFDTYQYKENDYFIGIEDGAYEIIKRGFKLELAIGDFDTTSHYDEIIKKALKVEKFPKEKDEIDLELALKYVIKHNLSSDIYIYNATLGRLDHEMITIKLLMKYHHLNLHLMNGNEEILYLTTNYVITEHYKRFSIITFEEVVIEVRGSLYELPKTKLNLIDCYTSSNKTNDEPTYINIFSGGIILVKEV